MFSTIRGLLSAPGRTAQEIPISSPAIKSTDTFTNTLSRGLAKIPIGSPSATVRFKPGLVTPSDRRWSEDYDDAEFNFSPGGSLQTLDDPAKTPRGYSHKTMRGNPHTAIRKSPLKGVTSAADLWNPDTSEFPDWPGNKELEVAVVEYRTNCGTFKKAKYSVRRQFETVHHIDSSTDQATVFELDPIQFLKNATEEEQRDMIAELKDQSCGDPFAMDLHDEIVAQFIIKRSPLLPVEFPLQHMHFLDWKAYRAFDSQVVQCARPRLCDAVTIVLFETNPKCLENFLNPKVKVFEWRRDIHDVVIRRSGNEILIGTFRSVGFAYIWTAYVRSLIDYTGKWQEVFAGVSKGKTPVLPTGPAWDEYEEINPPKDVKSTDEKFALYMGRMMSSFLIRRKVWAYQGWVEVTGYTVTWEADGVVTVVNDLDKEKQMDVRDSDED